MCLFEMFKVDISNLEMTRLRYFQWMIIFVVFQALSDVTCGKITKNDIVIDRDQNRVEEAQNDDFRRQQTQSIFLKSSLISKHGFKNLRKRDVDFCRDFRLKAGNRTVSSCLQPYKDGLFCNEKNCPPKPSYPNGIPNVQTKFNYTTKNVDMEISWKLPEFGRNNLCGFQLFISSLTSPLQTTCILINSKTHLSHVLHGANFNTRYNITVVSLPAYKDLDRSSKFIEIKVSAKCDVYRKHKVPLPWECGLSSFVPTSNCIDGAVNFTLEKPDNGTFDNFFVMVVPGNRFSPDRVFGAKYNKQKQHAIVNRGLLPGIKYVALVFYQLGTKFIHSIASKPFICKGELTTVNVSTCREGKVTATWNKVNMRKIRYKIGVYSIGDENRQKRILEMSKKNNSAKIIGLQKNVWYVTKVSAVLEGNQMIIGDSSSKKFMCAAETSRLFIDESNPDSLPIIVSLVLVAILVAVFVTLMVRGRRTICLRMRRFCFQTDHIKLDPDWNPPAPTLGKPVLLLYPSGCECMNKLMLVLATALREIGCDILLHLYNTIEAAKLSGREMYNEKKISEAGCVVMVFSEVTNQQYWDIFNGHVQAILKRIVENKDKSSKYIPISVGDVSDQDAWKSIIGRTDPIKSVNSPPQLSQLLLRCAGIEAYEEYGGNPTKNIPAITQTLSRGLEASFKDLNSMSHPQCQKQECSKGKDGNNGESVDSLNNGDSYLSLTNSLYNEFEMNEA